VSESRIKKAIINPKKAIQFLLLRLDVFVGKILFKNIAGLSYNISGRRELSQIKKISKDYLKRKSKNKLSEEFKLKGHVKLGAIYDESLINLIASEFDKIVENEEISNVRKHEGKVYYRITPSLHKQIPQVKKLITPQIIDFFEQYYGTPIKIVDVYGYRTYHVSKEIAEKMSVYSNDWHSDGHNITWTKILVYLTNVTVDDGPFNTQTISRTKELISMGFGDRNNPGLVKETLEDPRYNTVYTGPKGTAFAANTELCIHRATVPTQGHTRDVLLIQFAPSSEPLLDNWDIIKRAVFVYYVIKACSF